MLKYFLECTALPCCLSTLCLFIKSSFTQQGITILLDSVYVHFHPPQVINVVLPAGLDCDTFYCDLKLHPVVLPVVVVKAEINFAVFVLLTCSLLMVYCFTALYFSIILEM